MSVPTSPADEPGGIGDVTGGAALRLAVVGPTHPYKGGVAAHTTSLARELAEAGHEVTLVSWSHLYPSRLYPGEQAVPGGAPDVEPFPRTVRALSWARPDTWVRTGRRLRDVDAIIVVHVIPAVVPAHLALLRAAGASRTSGSGTGPRSVLLAHNILPHERHTGDEAVVRTLLRRVDAVLVHTPVQAKAAHDLDAEHVVVADLPPHLPGGPPVQRPRYEGPPRLLALGMVRDYKGVDVLMRALIRVPGPSLTVAGEMWGDAGRAVKQLAAHPALRDRVEVHEGYVPADRLPELLARHDVMALTYRTATASQNALLGQQHGLVVLASDVGSFGDQVRDDVDGLLVPVSDEDAVVAALRRLCEPATLERLRAGVRPPDLTAPWARYVGALEALASVEARSRAVETSDAEGPRSEQRSGRWSWADERARAVLARASRRTPRLEVTGASFPDTVRPTDVLVSRADADEAELVARQLGLPRTADPVAGWAALGALAGVLRVGDDGHRSALIVDESGARSPFGRWARAIGFAPIELELTGSRSSVAVLELETASLDVITRLHPNGCDADDVDEAMNQASWALRSGGLLSITVPVATAASSPGVAPADLRALLARAADLGFVLVGDVDKDLGRRIREATSTPLPPADERSPVAVVRLTLRRR